MLVCAGGPAQSPGVRAPVRRRHAPRAPAPGVECRVVGTAEGLPEGWPVGTVEGLPVACGAGLEAGLPDGWDVGSPDEAEVGWPGCGWPG